MIPNHKQQIILPLVLSPFLSLANLQEDYRLLSPTQPVQAAFLSPHANQVAAFSRLGDKPPLPSSRRPSKPQDTAILPTDLSTQATRHRHPTDRYLYLLLPTQAEAPPTPEDSTLHPPCATNPNTVGLLLALFRFIIESKIAEVTVRPNYFTRNRPDCLTSSTICEDTRPIPSRSFVGLFFPENPAARRIPPQTPPFVPRLPLLTNQ